MGSNGADKSQSTRLEVITGLERLFLSADSPGIKLAAGLALEILINRGIAGRLINARVVGDVSFAVSVTVLSSDMEKVLIKNNVRGRVLPYVVLSSDVDRRLVDVAKNLACSETDDPSIELALNGRPLAVEIWDDDQKNICIGLNYLCIARSTNEVGEWQSSFIFTEFNRINLNLLDVREALSLSAMLSIMGVKNPYDHESNQTTEISAA